jgi:hypothetical protein
VASTGKAPAKTSTLGTEAALRKEMELRDEARVTEEQIEQQDLNQGMDTGTHSSTHEGVNWGPSYRIRPEAEEGSATTERIETRAYQLYEQRGGAHGHDVEDWLTAEKELKQR